MKVTFLGTGTSQGVPIIGCQCEVCTSLDFRDKRLRTSAHVEADGCSLVIDTGPDFRQQALTNRISRLDAVLYTHQHKDHVAGMDEIRGFNYLQGTSIPIYARQAVVEQLRREFAYAFAEEKYPGIPQIEVYTIDDRPFMAGNLPVIPINVMHYKLPVFGYRIHDFTYITDANYISEEDKQKIRGSKVLVLNALQQQEHISHFSLQQALTLIESLQPERAFITHLSHRMGLHRKVSAQLPPRVELAYDGLSLEI